MSKNKNNRGSLLPNKTLPTPPTVSSLLANMVDGNEYGSIVPLVPIATIDLLGETVQAIQDIEKIRGRPCIAYIGNVVNGDSLSGIDPTDDLPFLEMISQVPPAEKKIDVILATNGGSAHQVSRFVNALRSRFDIVEFLLPSYCMSAGTIFALSGDKIWMTSRACMGPIDPQIPSKDGRFVPAQALLLLVQQLQLQGNEAMSKGQPVPWTAVRIIDSIDKKELGDAISASNYSTNMATEFLKNYRLNAWTTHASNGLAVTDGDRHSRAVGIADALGSHDRWKSHGHSISREVLSSILNLDIEHPETIPGLERALVRFWALCNWIFDKTPALKFIVSANYRYVRQRNTKG